MPKTKVLISVKTYPTLSKKYDELVCTAGFLEDGSWIRIYPVPYRKLDYASQYNKYQWIELDLVKNTKDFRPESYRPYDIGTEITTLNTLDTKNAWQKRKEIVLKHPVWTDMTALISSAKNPAERTSLAVFKPRKILDFIYEKDTPEWDQKKLEAVLSHQRELNLFEETKKIFKIAKKVPFKFSYIFTSDDGKERSLMIEDWEVGMLYWRSLESCDGNEEKACELVRKRYLEEFSQKDLYFFLGTSLKFHNVSKSPFMIIGVFYPPKVDAKQLSLF